MNIRCSEFVANCITFSPHSSLDRVDHLIRLFSPEPSSFIVCASFNPQNYTVSREHWPSPPSARNERLLVELCVSLERVLSFLLSISSHAFDSRPPPAPRFEPKFSFLLEILLSFTRSCSRLMMKKEHGPAVSNPCPSELIFSGSKY